MVSKWGMGNDACGMDNSAWVGRLNQEIVHYKIYDFFFRKYYDHRLS
jgi:hypothetical protein